MPVITDGQGVTLEWYRANKPANPPSKLQRIVDLFWPIRGVRIWDEWLRLERFRADRDAADKGRDPCRAIQMSDSICCSLCGKVVCDTNDPHPPLCPVTDMPVRTSGAPSDIEADAEARTCPITAQNCPKPTCHHTLAGCQKALGID